MRTIKRRRKECKTDYNKRLKLLKSERPRLVFRRTNRYLIAQYVTSHEAQDKIEFTLNSKNLLNQGWPQDFSGSLKSIPAAYLLGYQTAKKILKDKKETPIIDFGLKSSLHKTKPFGFLKGIIEGGLDISCPEEAFPEEERILGKNLKQDFSKTFEKIKSTIDKQ